jgi:hypothetical protein
MKCKHLLLSFISSKYLEQRTPNVGKFVGMLQKIERQLSLVDAIESHQTTIDSYFNRMFI